MGRLFLGTRLISMFIDQRRNVPIDTTLDTTSTNPVTNSAIATAISNLQTALTTAQSNITDLQTRVAALEALHTTSGNEGYDPGFDDLLG